MKKFLVKFIPHFLRPAVRGVYVFLSDPAEGWRSYLTMVPPESLDFSGSGNFKRVGEEFKGYFIELGKVKPDDKVLEVGCGIGRMAVPLTGYLSGKGGYWGFDIVKHGIHWCQTRISLRFWNFHFLHSDIYNKSYNPEGKFRADEFKFPYKTEFFDFVLLTSVFTHMLQPDVEHYLKEISRVLKPGGRCLTTFFLLNDESRKLIRSGRSSLDFNYEIQGGMTIDAAVPERALAYPEESVRRLFEKSSLVITEPIHYGYWCKRDKSLTYQDLVIASKPA